MSGTDMALDDRGLLESDELLALLLQEEGYGVHAHTDLVPVVAGSPHQPKPLSYAQERLWFLEHLTPGSGAYNMYMARRLGGHLNIVALRRSLDEIARRHQSLRTTFQIEDGRPVQMIAAAAPIPVPLLDLRGLPPDVRDEEAARRLALEVHAAFDLACGPLLRACLLQLEEDQHIFVLTMHHIISDGWSMGILEGELAALYSAFASGRPSPLPELPIQYADFAAWQRAWLQGDALHEHLGFWRRQLAGAPPLLALPTDRPRPAVQSFDGANHAFALSPSLTAKLRAFSRQEGVTLFMTLLATFQALLARYSGQNDISVGSFIAGRTRVETEGLIGFFINNLVLRTDLSGDPPFRLLLRRVRDVTLDAYAHQEVPFEKVIQEVQPERAASHSPLFQVMLVLQNLPAPATEMSGLSMEVVTVAGERSNFDLTLWMAEGPDHLIGNMQYSTALFDAATIEWMVEHLRTALEAVVADPALRISELPLLAGEERRLLLTDWAATKTAPLPNTCVHERIEAQVRHTPDGVAVVCGDRPLTYAELNRRANRLAHDLRALGVGPEVRVGLCMERSPELVVGLLGILKAGGAYVPLDPAYPPERLAFMAQDAQLAALVTQTRLRERLSADDVAVVCLDAPEWDDNSAGPGALNPKSGVTTESAAYVIYTSGSTGTPKGVVVEHGALANFVEAAITGYRLEPSDRVLQFSSISFDISVEEIVPCLVRGATLVLRDDAMTHSVPAFLAACRQWGITVLDLPTAFWHELTSGLEALDLALPPCVRLVIIGGERALPERVAAWHAGASGDVQLMNTYGPTEATVVATSVDTSALAVADSDLRDVPIGRPIDNVQAFILDERLQPAPLGVPGELYVGGAGLARGYLRRPGLTAERFIPHPFSTQPGARLYRTGDLARYRPDGLIDFLGRRDHQVKMRGFRIELDEIETALRSQAGVADAVVIARDDVPHQKRLVAYVVPRHGQALQSDELRRALHQTLPDYMVPTAYVTLDALPLRPNGKVDRAALPAPGQISAVHAGAGTVAPRDTVEWQLTSIWEQVLDVRPIDVRSSFFDLGGHSLLAVRLMARIQQQFDRTLSLATLFQAPSIEAMARLIREQSPEPEKPWSPLVPIQPSGTQRPLFFVHAGGGNVLCYVALARHLGPDQPFYGFQSQGVDGRREPLRRVEEMAALYIAAMKEVQPRGPYLLGGWCMGGVVALEMATQLRRLGEKVAPLILLDAAMLFPRGNAALAIDDTYENYRFSLYFSIPATLEELRALDPDRQMDHLLTTARVHHILPPDLDAAQFGHLVAVHKANSLAWQSYVPTVSDQAMIFLQAGERLGTARATVPPGWDEIVTGTVQVHSTPGDHFSMLKDPHVATLAAALKTQLTTLSEQECR